MKRDFIIKVFELLNACYNYVVLRNYEGLPEQNTSKDIDILIKKKAFTLLKPALVGLAADCNCGVLYEHYDHQFWTAVYADDEGEVFQLDFQYNFAWMGIDLLDENEVLSHRIFNGKVWHLDAMYEFLPKYLYCRILGGEYPEKYASVQQAALAAGEAEVSSVLNRLALCKGGLEYWNKASKWSLRLQSFAAATLRNPFRACWLMICFVCIYLWQLFTRRGWMMSFTGPDGCGKTTVIDLVMERLAVNPPHLFHFRPSFFPNLGELGHKAGIKKEVDRNFTEPHRAKRCGKLSSLLRLAYYMSDYILGYWIRIMPLRQRKFIVFFDRYFTDVIVDPERSSIFLSPKFLCRLRHLVPACQKNFLIRVEPEAILARKQELKKEDIERIYARMEDLAAKDRRCVWIDNNGTPEEAARQIILAMRQS